MTRFFILLFFITTALSLVIEDRTLDDGCLNWCLESYGKNIVGGALCVALAALKRGPCYICGPQKVSVTEQFCNGQCDETSTDNKNCGACGKVCPANSNCDKGICRPLSNCNAVEMCGNTPLCGTACICQPDERGKGYCNIPQLCSDIPSCNTIADCPVPGSVCLFTCCPGGKCWQPSLLVCSNLAAPRMIFEDRRIKARDGLWSGHIPTNG